MTNVRTGKHQATLHFAQAWRVREFCEAVRISRSHLYVLMKRGEIRTVTLGGRRLILTASALVCWGRAA